MVGFFILKYGMFAMRITTYFKARFVCIPLLLLLCSTAAMAATQKDVVKQAQLDRNFFNCKQGYSDCEEQLLTDAQKSVSKQAQLDRNFFNCKQGYSDCEEQLLTDAQKSVSEQAQLDRNFFNCKQGYSDCNEQLLDKSEAISEIDKTKRKPYWSHLSREEFTVAKVAKYDSSTVDAAPSVTAFTDELADTMKNTPSSEADIQEELSTNLQQELLKRLAYSDLPLDMDTVKLNDNSNDIAAKPVTIVPTRAHVTSSLYDSNAGGSRYYNYGYRPSVGQHYVESYTRNDGTQIEGHYQTNADDSFWNNWSSKGNTNPHTGRIGSTLPLYSSGSTYVSGYTRKDGTHVSGHYRRK
jgi:hypothetical protein